MSLFEVKNITVAFGGVKALNDVSFGVDKGEIFTIIGPNGAGKSTLFNVISRIYEPSKGEIYFENQNILDNLDLIKNHKVIIFTMALNDMDIILSNMNKNARCFVLHSDLNQPVQTGVIIHKTAKSSFMREYILETNVESIITEKI